jgi:hypothetical protein
MSPPDAGEDRLQAVKQYLDRVKELVPTEVTAAFLAINSAVPFDSRYLVYLYGFFAALLIACWLYLHRLQRVTSIQELIFITFIAFPVWAFNIAVSRFDSIADKTFIPACILIIVTVFSPLVVGPRQ